MQSCKLKLNAADKKKHSFIKAVEKDNLRRVKKFVTRYNVGNDLLSQLLSKINSVEMVNIILKHINCTIIDYYKKCGTSIILEALKTVKNIEIIRQIILFSKDIINDKDLNVCEETPLLYCVKHLKNVDLTEFLLCYKPNVNECDRFGFSPLHYAHDLKTVKLLCDNGADVNLASKNRLTPLLVHIKRMADSDVILELIKRGADTDAFDENGNNTVILAILTGCNDMVVYELIEKSLDPCKCNNNGDSPFLSAIQHRYDEKIVFELLKRGADVNVANRNGMTPLLCALQNRYERQVIHRLIESGANVDAYDCNGISPFLASVLFQFRLENSIIIKMLNKTSNVNAIHPKGKPAFLHVMKFNKDCRIIKEFLNCKVDVTCIDSLGNGVLHFIRKNTLKFLNVFLERGASINLKNYKGMTPLMTVVKWGGSVEVVESLLKSGSDPNLVDSSLNTALHYAFDNEVIGNLLCLHGANYNIKNINNELPMFKKLKDNHIMCSYPILKNALLVSEDLKIPNECFSLIPNLSDFIKKCKDEIDKMKCSYIDTKVSLHDLYVKKYKFINSVNFVVVNNDLNKIRPLFPLFYDLIFAKVKTNIKIQNRFKRLNNLTELILQTSDVKSAVRISGNDLHDSNQSVDSMFISMDGYCVRLIGRYLNEREMSSLILASI